MSATENSDSSSSFILSSNISGSETGDFSEIGGIVEPYRFEPSAPEGDEESENEEDEDWLTPAILEA